MTRLKLAALLVFAFVVLEAAGAGEHASVIVGMPRGSLSFLLGPLYVLARLGALIVAPPLVLSVGIERLVTALQRPKPR